LFCVGKPAHYGDMKNPDWTPTLKMGYIKNSGRYFIFIMTTNEIYLFNVPSTEMVWTIIINTMLELECNPKY